MMMNFKKGLETLIGQYDRYIIDLYGVVHNGQVPFEGVKDFLETLRDQNKMVIFLSNSPRRGYAVAESLREAFGITDDLYDDIYTSGEDAYINLMHPEIPAYKDFNKKCIAITEKHHKVLFDDLSLNVTDNPDDATFIMNTGPSGMDEAGYKSLFEETLKRSLPMLCVNPDLAVLLGSKMTLCAGSIAKMYEEMGGKVYYHGKPYPAIYEAIINKFGPIEKNRLLAIGDSLNTDILGASRMDLDSLLVLSGMEGRALAVKGDQQPDYEAFATLCETKGAKPTYVAPSLKL